MYCPSEVIPPRKHLEFARAPSELRQIGAVRLTHPQGDPVRTVKHKAHDIRWRLAVDRAKC